MKHVVYNFFLIIFCIFSLPGVLYQYVFRGKYRSNFSERFGLQLPAIKKRGKKLVWIHAVSVGEARAAAPLARLIRSEMKGVQIVVSSGTETGQAEAKRAIPFADDFVFLPLDFPWLMRRLVENAVPDYVIVSETDYWYNFLHSAKEKGARLIVANGKISESSLRRYKRFLGLIPSSFSLFDLVCAQNEEYAERFKALGVDEMRVCITGNLKFDITPKKLDPEGISFLRGRLGISATSGPIVVVGSTHDGEENEILEQLKIVWKKFPNLKALIVPRHPERFEDVAKLLKEKNLAFSRYSSNASATSRVTLVDAMGVLNDCYQVADVAIVGGSFVKGVGGHNILEPSVFGVPVLFGPHMEAQTEFATLAKEYGAGVQVESSELASQILSLLQTGREVGLHGLELTEKNQGAAQRTYDLLVS